MNRRRRRRNRKTCEIVNFFEVRRDGRRTEFSFGREQISATTATEDRKKKTNQEATALRMKDEKRKKTYRQLSIGLRNEQVNEKCTEKCSPY